MLDIDVTVLFAVEAPARNVDDAVGPRRRSDPAYWDDRRPAPRVVDRLRPDAHSANRHAGKVLSLGIDGVLGANGVEQFDSAVAVRLARLPARERGALLNLREDDDERKRRLAGSDRRAEA